MTDKKKFTASFSTGKDCTLAIYKAIKAGYEPAGLITTRNTDGKIAWFHQLPRNVLDRLSDCIGIPIFLMLTGGKDYEKNFQERLLKMKEMGAKLCVFGDIDIQAHKDWGEALCRSCGLAPLYPLWGMSRRQAVEEFIESGFKARITAVDTTKMDRSYLGEAITPKLIEKLEQDNVDVRGENGEYHTIVTDGPIFKKPLEITFGSEEFDGRYATLSVM